MHSESLKCLQPVQKSEKQRRALVEAPYIVFLKATRRLLHIHDITMVVGIQTPGNWLLIVSKEE